MVTINTTKKGDDHDRHHLEHDHDAFESFVVTLGEIADAKAFADQNLRHYPRP